MCSHSCHFLLDHVQFTLIHGAKIPDSYVIFFFTASDFTLNTSHIHHWVLFLLWLHLFILSGVISPLSPVAYWAPTDTGSSSFSVTSFCLFIPFMEFSRQNIEVVCHSFSSGPRFVRNLQHDPSILGGPTGHGS